MKRNNCFFWKSAVLSALAVLTLGISAGAVEYSGICGAEGGNAAWKLDAETGLMTISGQGALAEYNSSNPVPWGPSSPLWPGMAIKDAPNSRRDIGILPADWAASRTKGTPYFRQRRAISSTGRI